MVVIEIILFYYLIKISCWLFKGITGYDVVKEHYRYLDASEARQQTTNKDSNSFADAVFWSDLGNH